MNNCEGTLFKGRLKRNHSCHFRRPLAASNFFFRHIYVLTFPLTNGPVWMCLYPFRQFWLSSHQAIHCAYITVQETFFLTVLNVCSQTSSKDQFNHSLLLSVSSPIQINTLLSYRLCRNKASFTLLKRH